MGGVSAPPNPPRDGEGDRRPKAGGGGGSSRILRRPEVYEARRARRQMSLPEAMLWQRLKGTPQGISFRKQHPIGSYRADFYCASAKLVIEIDGVSHDMGDRPVHDERRTAVLGAEGYAVLRIPAADVLNDADGAAASIVAYAANPLHPAASRRGPPPRPGEDC